MLFGLVNPRTVPKGSERNLQRGIRRGVARDASQARGHGVARDASRAKGHGLEARGDENAWMSFVPIIFNPWPLTGLLYSLLTTLAMRAGREATELKWRV